MSAQRLEGILSSEESAFRTMQGHWVLARMGKKVLRPGGVELTGRMVEFLAIGHGDEVVEFAPGLGVTARLTLARNPLSYAAVERDDKAALVVRSYLTGSGQRCLEGTAKDTGLPAGSATVVYGEAMLTMHMDRHKRQIIGEAYRLLKQAGRYGIHEMCLFPDDIEQSVRQEIQKALSKAIHISANPITVPEWRDLLGSEGFATKVVATAPMALLTPKRLVQDEGLCGALRFVCNVMKNAEARKRISAMRGVFSRYGQHLAAIVMVGIKK